VLIVSARIDEVDFLTQHAQIARGADREAMEHRGAPSARAEGVVTRFRHDGPKRPTQTRGTWQYVYNGRILVAIIELRSDDSRWHVISNGKNYSTREDALASLRGAA
jgi:hypothetical protein